MDPVRKIISCGSFTSHTALFPHRVMAKLYQLDDLVARLPVDRRSLKTELEGSIKVGVDEIWMGRRGERGRGQHVIIPICLYHTHLSSFFFLTLGRCQLSDGTRVCMTCQDSNPFCCNATR